MSRNLTPLTGYVRGGLFPIGMKSGSKPCWTSGPPTRPPILVSGRAKIGCQVGLAPGDLAGLVGARLCRYYKGMTP